MQTFLITVHLLVVIALVAVVLLQRSEGGALGMGGGGFMSGRAQANALTRTTAVLAAIFFATSLGLTLLANMNRAPKSIFEGVKQEAPQNGSSVLDQLKQIDQNAPASAVPAAPASSTTPSPSSAPGPAK
jgi:preprotein translocase subunit SecG